MIITPMPMRGKLFVVSIFFWIPAGVYPDAHRGGNGIELKMAARNMPPCRLLVYKFLVAPEFISISS